MLSNIILPDAEQLHLEEISLETGKLILKVIASQKSYCCPGCQTSSAWVHSHYRRKLADLPCGGIQIQLLWTVRRFFCDNHECSKATFVEQISMIAARYARRTCRLNQQQTVIGFVVGGEPGAKLTRLLEIPTSPDTLWRMVRKAPEAQTSKVKAISVKTLPWAASRAAWFMVLDQDNLNQEEKAALEQMVQTEPLVATTIKLVHEFLHMLRTRQAEVLLDWLKRAHECRIEALKSLINSLENDLYAVCAVFSMPWSNDPTEGNVNRLQLIKHQMYGRANFDLLRHRVLGITYAP